MKIILITPMLEGRSKEELLAIQAYTRALQHSRHSVTRISGELVLDRKDKLAIFREYRGALKSADEIHVWWGGLSPEMIFLSGVAFGEHKTIFLANPRGVVEDSRNVLATFLHGLHSEYLEKRVD